MNSCQFLFKKDVDLEANQQYTLSFGFIGMSDYNHYKIAKEEYPFKQSIQVKEGQIELTFYELDRVVYPVLDAVLLITA
jgi:hypothetical protein